MAEILCLTDIIRVEKWQNIQDHFSEVLGITMVTLDKDGRFITKMSNSPRLCRETLKTSIKAIAECKDWLSLKVKSAENRWEDGVVCPFGLHSFFIPLRVIDRTLAYLLVGPLVVGKHRSSFESKEIESLGLDPQDFFDALRDIKVFTFYRAKSTIDFLYDICSYILQLEYQNGKLKKREPNFLDVVEKVYNFYIDRLLSALLEVTFGITCSNRASLMLFDEKTNKLYIKKARGIAKDVVENTRLSLGEGIAGIVAKERKALFITDKTTDMRLKSRMHKPEIKTSLSMPIEIDKKLIGVLNIAILKSCREKLSLKSAETIQNFIKLIESAIRDFPKDSLQ